MLTSYYLRIFLIQRVMITKTDFLHEKIYCASVCHLNKTIFEELVFSCVT